MAHLNTTSIPPLFIENVGDTPTFDNGRWKNIIDLTITNQLGHNLVDVGRLMKWLMMEIHQTITT